MSDKQELRGQCCGCGQLFEKRVMTRHLQSCVATKMTKLHDDAVDDGEKVFHLLVEGYRMPHYWLHVAAPATCTLADLDAFLRDIWLECCDHLSQFIIEGEYYNSDGTVEFDMDLDFDMDDEEDTDDEQDIDDEQEPKLSELLAQGLKFKHQYDFGSTTTLELKVLAERQFSGNELHLLARNEPPVIPCDRCGQPAKWLCGECMYWDKGVLCESCARKHECDDDSLLPIANSPRFGVCGYTGAD